MGDSEQVIFTDGVFQEKHIDSREYLKFYGVDPTGCDECLPFTLRHLHETFLSGIIKGKRLIDIGSGPTIHIIISASKYFEEIVVSDFASGNRREIEKWLKNEKGCFDWRHVIEFVCELEGRSRSPEDVEQRLRQTVKQVLKCDVTQENPFHPLTMEPADCITSSLCLEGACKDLGTYLRALRSVASLLKPGGSLVLIAALNQSFYRVGQERVNCLVLSQSFIEEAVKGQGFSIQQVNIHCVRKEKECCDCDSFIYLIAQKTE